MHIKKARDLLDRLDQQAAEHEVWRQEHSEELLNAETDALLAKCKAATVKQRDFASDRLIYKRRENAQVQPPQATTMSSELQAQWNDWADQRIRDYVNQVVKLIAQESGDLTRHEIEKATAPLYAEIAALRIEVALRSKKKKPHAP